MQSKRRRDVSIVCLNYPPEPTGIAPYTGALATGLRGHGYNVSAHVAHPHYPEWEIYRGYGEWRRIENINGVTVHRRRHYVPRSPQGLRRLMSEISYGIRLVFGRWNTQHVVIAVSPSLFSTALAILRFRVTRRRPVLIIWLQDIYTLGLSETGQGSGYTAKVIKWVEGSTLRTADQVVVIHDRFMEYVISEFEVEPSKVSVVRNWTHLEGWPITESSGARKQLGWPEGVTLAVHTGNMGVKQGLENIVEAARIADKRSEPIHFVLVGDGSQKARLLELADGVVRLTFVEPLSEEDYQAALVAADVLLVNEMPGVSEMAVPSKLTSYFHAGRPIVGATDMDGITASEINTAQAGVVVPAGRPEVLLDAVLALAGDSEKAAQFSSNGRLYRESVLSSDAAIQQWVALLENISTVPIA